MKQFLMQKITEALLRTHLTQVQSIKFIIAITVGLMFSVSIRPFRVNSSPIKTNCKEIHHIRNNCFCPINKNLLRSHSASFLTRHPIYIIRTISA